MRYGFGLSFALNLFLLTTIVAARVDVSRESTNGSRTQAESFRFDGLPAEHAPVSGVRDLAVRLESAGLGNRDIKASILGWLTALSRDAATSEVTHFWQADYRPGLNEIRRRIEIERRVRAGLLDFYGSDAATDPAFATVFRPLGQDYDFLTSEAQLDLQIHQLAVLEAQEVQRALGASTGRCQPSKSVSDRTTPSLVPESFGASAINEYRLRFSSLAQQLRASVAIDGEPRFRSLFDRLMKLEQAGSPHSQAKVRQELRVQMGDRAFDRFWSNRDPLFVAVESYLRGQGSAPQLVLDAYAVINRSQDSLLEAVANNASQDAMIESLQQIRSVESAALARLLGDKVAAGLEAAKARAAISMSETSKTTC